MTADTVTMNFENVARHREASNKGASVCRCPGLHFSARVPMPADCCSITGHAAKLRLNYMFVQRYNIPMRHFFSSKFQGNETMAFRR